MGGLIQEAESLEGLAVLHLPRLADPSRTSALGPSRLPSTMLGATLSRRRGWPNGPMNGRLLNFLEGVIGWNEARNPSLSETAVHPTV